MVENLIANKKVAFFTGCFANYYYPEVAKDMVEVLHHSGVEVIVPNQVCCALPMTAKGNTRGARKNIEYNVRIFSEAVANGYAIITTCSSCSLFIKRDYQLLGSEKAKQVALNTYHYSDYLMKLHEIGQLNTDFKHIPQTVFYHTPCHLKIQGGQDTTVEMLKLIPGISVKYVSKECCGMGGAYGYEKKNYKLALEIGNRLFDQIKENPTERVVTDCGGCKLQMEAGTGLKVDHPLILLHEAYNFTG